MTVFVHLGGNVFVNPSQVASIEPAADDADMTTVHLAGTEVARLCDRPVLEVLALLTGESEYGRVLMELTRAVDALGQATPDSAVSL